MSRPTAPTSAEAARPGIYTTPTNPYPHFGFTAYRIEIDVADPHRPMQRHIWTRADGTEEAEPWMRTLSGTTAEGLMAAGYTLAKATAP